MQNSNPSNSSVAPGPRPFWIPADVNYDQMSVDLRSAIEDILLPLYQRLVIEELDPILRATGEHLAFLTGQALFEQFSLGKLQWRQDVEQAIRDKFDRYLRLGNSQAQATKLLVELRKKLAALDPRD